MLRGHGRAERTREARQPVDGDVLQESSDNYFSERVC